MHVPGCDLYHKYSIVRTDMDAEINQAWTDLLDWFRGGTRIVYQKGEVIIRPEVEPPGVFLLTDGFLKVYTLTKQGDQNIRGFKKPGHLFPLVWAIQKDQQDTYYQAVTEIESFRRSRDEFNAYIEETPQLGVAVLRQVAEWFARHADRINNLEFRFARERIAYRLHSLAKQYGEDTPSSGRRILLPIKQSELADSVNVTRETASRELRRLRKKKIISYTDNTYFINDIEQLKKEF